jgi:16S rRNA (cytosine967-C5)-methyltransferase
MLDAVLRRGRTLDAAAGAERKLSPADHGLAIAIAGETLRRLRDLDELIDSATRNPLADDSKARTVLRMALAQKIGLGTPDHALVATALPLVDGGPRRLVHGVLGTLLRQGLPTIDAPRLPPAVEQRWGEAWGESVIAAARYQMATRPALDLTFAYDSEAQSYARANGGTSLASNHVRLASSSVSDLPGFGEGRWWVQDLAASLPARMIANSSRDVLDLCAAPGGKTMQLAAAGHSVTSVDASASRLGRLRDNLDRTHLAAALVEADALTWVPHREFDAILLDAPCSATGTFRRHPEVLYRARPRIIADNAELQAALLDRASKWLKPGGALTYAVCSLEPKEGEQVIADFLAGNPDFVVAPPEPGELPEFVTPTAEGYVRVLPGLLESEGGLDGFFIARLVRRG